MFVSLLPQLTESEPFQVKRQNPALREIDAALLLILHGFPLRPDVTVEIQDCRRFGWKFFRLVENRDRLKARNDLIAEFAKTVSLMGLDCPEVFEPGWRVDPFLGPAVKHDFLQ